MTIVSKRSYPWAQLGTILVTVCAALTSGCARQQVAEQPEYHVDIRRTGQGIPHILAADWRSLGLGEGYVQAQDDLCTLADGFVTFRGERSAFFGPDARPASAATFGQPRNVDADFFFKVAASPEAVARYRAAQTPKIQDLVTGFAAGYNRYVDGAKAGHFPGAHAACVGAPWVTRIGADDVYRRLIAASLAGGEARFVTGIAQAQPPQANVAKGTRNTGAVSGTASATISATISATRSGAVSASAEHVASSSEGDGQVSGAPVTVAFDASQLAVGGHEGIGSNAWAFGAKTTRDRSSLLFGNPHWFWKGPDRFYQMQLTIPGELNVAGVGFLGVPVVMIGFNDHVAWTHTVSSARRFGLFQLTLAAGNPTHYVYDGHDEAMQATRITVQTRGADGVLTPVTRTMYRSRFGPLIDLSSMSPALAWNTQHAYVLRDVNADNPRVFENFVAWNQASSLDDFIAIQKRLKAVPWVNTFAIGRNDPRVWFSDIGAVPNVPDTLARDCTPPVGRAFDMKAPGVPFLDGSRSACNWGSYIARAGATPATQREENGTMMPGDTTAQTLPTAQMPSLERDDYVGNFNGSYWLTSPVAPLSGYARVTGETGTEQTLRTRYGHQIAAALLQLPGGITRDALEAKALDSTSLSERMMREPILSAICASASVSAPFSANGSEAFGANTKLSGNTSSAIEEACHVLSAWDGSADADARGANLWDAFWVNAIKLPPSQLYSIPFNANQPLTTPRGLNPAPETIAALRKALADAVGAMRALGVDPASRRGDLLYTQRGKQRIPLYGGCNEEGYFTVVCAQHPLDKAGYAMDRSGQGESYLQVVQFGRNGPVADTMLSHSESDDAASSHFSDATWAFAKKEWLRFPFTEAAIANDRQLTTQALR